MRTVRPGTLPTEDRKYHKSRKIMKLCVFHATHPPKHSGALKSQRTRSGSVTHLRVSLSACFERVSGHPKLYGERVNTDRTARRPVQRHSPHIFANRMDFKGFTVRCPSPLKKYFEAILLQLDPGTFIAIVRAHSFFL